MLATESSPRVVAQPEPEPPRNPYPGLRPFEKEDADLFFGRETHIDELLARLAQHRFVAVVGPSGCGKSSLTRAGLIPALLDGMLPGASHAWAVGIMRPGGKPEQALRDCLTSLLPPPPVIEAPPSSISAELPADAAEGFDAPRFYLQNALDGSRDALARAAAQLVVGSNADNVLLLVDQFEEVFRFNRRPGDETEWYERSNSFVQQLLAAVAESSQGPRGNVYVVLTMRDEFVGRCAVFPGLAEAMNQGLYLVPRLTRAQLADAVRLPAKCGGRAVSSGLAERVVNDSISVQDELPVLQHAMMRTWLTLEPAATEVTLDDYRGVGSVQRALDVHGNEIVGLQRNGERNRNLSAEEFRLCELVFKRLTLDSGDESTRAPASLQELADVAGVTPKDRSLLRVLDLFRASECQFLSPSPKLSPQLKPDTEIDLTHEAILRTWLVLKHWASDERKDAGVYRRLLDGALQWEKSPSSSMPLREPQLSSVLSWWSEHQPSAAWAARYHPAPTRLAQDGLEQYTEKRGQTAVPRHAELHEAAWRFLKRARDERDTEHALEQQRKEDEDRRKRAELRNRLLNYILGPALLILGIASLFALMASRAKSEAASQAADAARKETEVAKTTSKANAALAEASRLRAEAKEKEADAAQASERSARDELAAREALGAAEEQLKTKVRQLEKAERKAVVEADAARQQAARAQKEADAATAELGKLASINERSKELDGKLNTCRAELASCARAKAP